MANDQPRDHGSRDIDAHRKGGDVMRGRSFAGAEYGANEEEQTRERERVARGQDHTDEVGEITETELDEGEE
jgi:hypothetical protein